MPKANRRKQAAKKASVRAAVLPSDAALIAAAPDLLEACENAVSMCRFGCDTRIYCAICGPLFVAIAKAKGEHP